MPGQIPERRIPNRIFVGGLNETINEDDLRNLFGQYGQIQEVHLKNRGDKSHRGHGFVTYKSVAMAIRALEKGEGERLEIRGIKLNVRPAILRLHRNGDPRGSPRTGNGILGGGPPDLTAVSTRTVGMSPVCQFQPLGMLPYQSPYYNYNQMVPPFWPGYPVTPSYCPCSTQPLLRYCDWPERLDSPPGSVAGSQSSCQSTCSCHNLRADSQVDSGRDSIGSYRLPPPISPHSHRNFEGMEQDVRHRPERLSRDVDYLLPDSADRCSHTIGERHFEERFHTRRY